MLTGAQPFAGMKDISAAYHAKNMILDQLPHVLPPEEIAFSELLLKLLRKLVHPDPEKRFQSAEEADLASDGAAQFQDLLVKGDLSSQYETEIRQWMEEIEHSDFTGMPEPTSDSESIYLASTRSVDAE